MAFANPTEVPINACETVSGRYVDAVNPDPADIIIEDIAWSLSRQARFAGHTLSEEIWSVAQHSVFVLELVELALGEYTPLKTSLEKWLCPTSKLELQNMNYDLKRLLQGALMHDSSEAYLVDIPSPVKRHQLFREPYKALEKSMMSAISTALKLQELNDLENEIVTWADMLALRIEAANLMPSRGRGWNGNFPDMSISELHLMPAPLHWKEVYKLFMSEYHALSE